MGSYHSPTLRLLAQDHKPETIMLLNVLMDDRGGALDVGDVEQREVAVLGRTRVAYLVVCFPRPVCGVAAVTGGSGRLLVSSLPIPRIGLYTYEDFATGVKRRKP